MLVLSQESELSFICVVVFSILPVYDFLLDFGTVQKVLFRVFRFITVALKVFIHEKKTGIVRIFYIPRHK